MLCVVIHCSTRIINLMKLGINLILHWNANLLDLIKYWGSTYLKTSNVDLHQSKFAWQHWWIFKLFMLLDFNKNHHNFFGWLLRRLWIRNGLLKWQHYFYHTKKMKNVDSKKCKKKVNKNKIKHHQMKNLLLKWIENFLIYIFLIFKRFKWHDCYKVLSLRIHFTFKILIFCMDFLINHMFRAIHRLANKYLQVKI
jgi:hypothetical protein